jgi:hypothetical protein
MEVIRGRESDCRQEVRSAVERGGTRRSTMRPAATLSCWEAAPGQGFMIFSMTHRGSGRTSIRFAQASRAPFLATGDAVTVD